MQKTVAIIIINYNGAKDTIECLSSIKERLIGVDDIFFEVALLDNHSVEPIPDEVVYNLLPTVHYYKSKENLGFAGGNNLAIRNISKDVDSIDYYFLLNNDTVLVDDSLVRLVKLTDKSDYGITGLVNYYYSHPEECWQAGSMVRAVRLTGKEVNPFDYNDGQFVEVDTVPGSSLLIKKSVVDAIGLLDEDFFAYYEELDWCLRAKENGFKVSFLSGTRLLHKVGRSSTSSFKHYLRTRNTLLLYSKHFKNKMSVARMRVFLRTLSETVRYHKWELWAAYNNGIRDFKNKKYGKGSLKI